VGEEYTDRGIKHSHNTRNYAKKTMLWPHFCGKDLANGLDPRGFPQLISDTRLFSVSFSIWSQILPLSLWFS